jgi:hypothetical protein
MESSSRSYDSYLIELGIFEAPQQPIANATVSMTPASDINESNIGGSKQFLVHPNGEHTTLNATNKKRFEQRRISPRMR